MISRRFALLLAIVAMWTLSAIPASAQTMLRYKFKEGDTLRYGLEQKMKMAMNIMGKAIDMNMDQTSDMIWHIKGVDSQGNAKILLTFGRNKMNMDTPMGKIAVDSQSGDEPDDQLGKILYKVIKTLSGLEVSATLSPLGEYSDIKIPEKSLKELQEVPGAAGFGDIFTADGLKRMMGQSGLIMPKEAVSQGSTWKNKVEMKLPIGKMIAETEYVYNGPAKEEGSVHKITLKPKATLEPDPNAPFAMKLKSQEGTGSALFDNASGRLLEIINNQTMEMEAEIMGMAFSQRMVQTVTLRLSDKK